MLKEIGSNFWINPEELKTDSKEINPAVFGFKDIEFIWTSSCRGAISLALDDIKLKKNNSKKIVLLPEYCCETIIEPFSKNSYEICFYRINEKLDVDFRNIIELLERCRNGIILIHKYFGFDSSNIPAETISRIKSYNITIIEDRTQCLYSNVPLLDADYYVGSLRKWCGVPDGGFVAASDSFAIDKPSVVDTELEELKLKASRLKYKYIVNDEGDKNAFLKLYGEAESKLDNHDKVYAISDASVAIQNNLDVDDLIQRRRSNYEYLKAHLNIKCLFADASSDIVPLYFPIVVDNRKRLQVELRNHDIYAPIIWPKPDELKGISNHPLYESLLCLPIDQRYDEDDMQRMSGVINEYYGRQDGLYCKMDELG